VRTPGSTRCDRRPSRKEIGLPDLNLSPGEDAALTIARLFLRAIAEPASGAWIDAMRAAEARFGPRDGPVIAARVLDVIGTIRRSRRSVFMFNAPGCPCCAAIVTEHERRMMLAISALRRGRTAAARGEVMMLCEGHGAERTLAALGALGTALDGDRDDPAHRLQHARAAR
jgi:hypothetical protein